MKDNEEFIEVVKKTPFSVIITIICFFSIWSVIGLAGFHTYLTASDQTTNEDVSFSIKSELYSILLLRLTVCIISFNVISTMLEAL